MTKSFNHFNLLIRNTIAFAIGILISINISVPYSPEPPILEIWIIIFLVTNFIPFGILYTNYRIKSIYKSIIIHYNEIHFQSKSAHFNIEFSEIESVEKITSYENATAGFLPWVEGRFYYYKVKTDSRDIIITSLYDNIFSPPNIQINKKAVFFPNIK